MSQRGQALTELALLSIILIFILLGADDFARLYQQNTALQEAAREGARHAAFYSSGTNTNPYLNNSASIVSVVSTVLNGAGLATASVTWQGSSQCPANSGAAPNNVNQVYVYGCIPTAAATCPGGPTGAGQDVDIAVVMRFNLVVQSNLFFGPAFPMNGDGHFRVQGC